jgi:hypothetical protein
MSSFEVWKASALDRSRAFEAFFARTGIVPIAATNQWVKLGLPPAAQGLPTEVLRWNPKAVDGVMVPQFYVQLVGPFGAELRLEEPALAIRIPSVPEYRDVDEQAIDPTKFGYPDFAKWEGAWDKQAPEFYPEQMIKGLVIRRRPGRATADIVLRTSLAPLFNRGIGVAISEDGGVEISGEKIPELLQGAFKTSMAGISALSARFCRLTFENRNRAGNCDLVAVLEDAPDFVQVDEGITAA